MSLSFNHKNGHTLCPYAPDELHPPNPLQDATAHPDKHNAKDQLSSTDERNAMWYYLRAALRGDKDAQYKMGIGYLKGELSLDRSYVHAERWLDQASYQGHQKAKRELEKALTEISIS